MLNRELYIDIKMCDNENGGKVVSLHNVIPNYDLIKDHRRHDIVSQFMRDMLDTVDRSSAKIMAEDKIVNINYGEFKSSDPKLSGEASDYF